MSDNSSGGEKNQVFLTDSMKTAQTLFDNEDKSVDVEKNEIVPGNESPTDNNAETKTEDNKSEGISKVEEKTKSENKELKDEIPVITTNNEVISKTNIEDEETEKNEQIDGDEHEETNDSAFDTQSQISMPKVKFYTPGRDSLISIMNFETKCTSEIPEFTEDETILAMKKLAIEPRMIKKVSDSDLEEFLQYPEVKTKAEAILNSRRDSLINQIKDEREKLFMKSKMEPVKASTAPVNRTGITAQSSRAQVLMEEQEKIKKADIERIEKLQKREIEQLIISELIKEQMLREETLRQERRETKNAEYEKEVLKKKEDDIQKRKEKIVIINQRLAEKDARENELRKKQEDEIEKNKKLIQEKKEKQLLSIAEVEKRRQQKANQKRELLEKQIEEEKKKIVEKQQEQMKREILMAQRRADVLKQIKEKNKETFESQKRRFEQCQQKEKIDFEAKKTKIEKKEECANERIDIIKKKIIQDAEQHRAKSQSLVERHIRASERIKSQHQERIEKIVMRESLDEERRLSIKKAKIEKMQKERLELEKKRKNIEMQNHIVQEKMKLYEEEIKKQWEEEDKRVFLAKKAKEDRIEQMVALQKLKDKIRDETAGMIEKQVEIKIKEKAEISADREERALIYVHHKAEEAERKKQIAIQLAFKKEEIMNKFNEILRKGGQLNINELAQEFNIDVEVLKKRVEESKSHLSANKPEPKEGEFSGYNMDGMDVQDKKD